MPIKEPYKSVGETVIAEILTEYKIPFEYEKAVLISEKREGDSEKARIWYPDFFLPKQNLIIEYFGMTHDKNYMGNVEWKKKVFSKMGFKTLFVYKEDIFGKGRKVIKGFEDSFILGILAKSIKKN